MLKTAPCLDRAKPMRHLRVPSEETQQWLDFCRKKRWIMPSAGVLTFDNGMKGIPILDSAPDEGNEFWQGNSIITAQGLTRGPEHWSERLNEETLSQIIDTLPKSHEIQGDILMVKIDQSIEEYSQEIAHAMLEQFPSIRLVCADKGVKGDFRVRDLLPISSRDGNKSTRTKIRENGQSIWTDPAKAYFSARLSNERIQNLSSAIDLKNKLNRKLRVCDPYAGVGPGIIPLVIEDDLISHCAVGDLNPDAFELLELNFQELISKNKITGIKLLLENIDARTWKNTIQELGQIDLLLVNLPHDSIDHLPELIPLLSRGSLTKIRGWAIIEKSELIDFEKEIIDILKHANAEIKSVNSSEVKGFSSTKIFMRFETEQIIH